MFLIVEATHRGSPPETVCPVPSVILLLLLESCLDPWAYSQRLRNRKASLTYEVYSMELISGRRNPSSETAATNLIGQERRASIVVSAVFRAFRSPCLLPRLLPHQRAACRLILTPPIPCCESPPHEASCSSISCPTSFKLPQLSFRAYLACLS